MRGTCENKIAAEALFSRDLSGHDCDQFEPWGRWSWSLRCYAGAVWASENCRGGGEAAAAWDEHADDCNALGVDEKTVRNALRNVSHDA
jgi:hypothetical protein